MDNSKLLKEIEELKRENQQLHETVRKTTLKEYLRLCHEHLHKIFVQTKALSTKGDIKNPSGKCRPDYIQPWTEFLETQKSTLDTLYSTYSPFEDEKVFNSLHFLETLGENKNLRKLASELDLHGPIRNSVEDPLTYIMAHLQSKDPVRAKLGIPQDFWFDNHLNSLRGSDQKDGPQSEAPHIQPSTPPDLTLSKSPSKSPLQPDQICVYTTVEGFNKPVLVAEFKPPHKLTLDDLRRILKPARNVIKLHDVINRVTTPRFGTNAYAEVQAETRVAAVITQTFAYMVQCETQYGYITTGEAFVFLRIKPEENVRNVHYYLAEPIGDVDSQKELSPDNEHYLRHSAVSQLLAFSILALRSVQEGRAWRNNVVDQLAVWDTDVEAIFKQFSQSPESAKKHKSPNWRPSRSKLDDSTRETPISKRLRSSKSTCQPESKPTSTTDQDSPTPSDDESLHPATPTRSQAAIGGKQHQRAHPSTDAGPSSRGNQKRSFCTQLCLQGLARGGPLDHQCPNVLDHCEEGYQGDEHHLNCETFLWLLGKQLLRNRGDGTRALGIQGARGALFQVTLMSYGYTVAAKGTVRAFVKDLRHEAKVYRRLTSIQGVYVPVFLGSIDLEKPFYYDAGILIVHLMLMSWSGECLSRSFWSGECPSRSEIYKDMDRQVCTSELVRAVNAIHAAGVLHGDLRMPNLLWNSETQRVMVVDFERAAMVKIVQRALSSRSPNSKRKWSSMAKVDGEDNAVERTRKDVMIHLEMACEIKAAETAFTSAIGE